MISAAKVRRKYELDARCVGGCELSGSDVVIRSRRCCVTIMQALRVVMMREEE